MSVGRDFGKAAVHYREHAHLQREVLGLCADMLGNFTPEGARLLDIGCGPGALSQLYGGAPPWRIVGIDIAEGMCREASRFHPAVCARGEALPLKNHSMPAAISSLALQWVEDERAFFAEVARVLEPGAPFVLSTFGPSTLIELRAAFAPDEAGHVSRFTPPDALLSAMEQAGFSVLGHVAVRRFEEYADMRALMRGIKSIGAANKRGDRRRGLTPPSVMQRAEERYRRYFSTPGGVTATWEILYFELRMKA